MALRPPSLRSFAAFEAIARHGSFGGAAVELNLTASALSHSIASLEARLDRRLFNRLSSGVELTEAGISLLSRVRLSLGLLSDVFELTGSSGSERLVISALPSVVRKLILPGLPDLMKALPGVRFEFHATTAVESVEFGVDVAIRFGPGGWRGVESHFIAKEELIVVASPEYWNSPLPDRVGELKSCNLIADRESSWRLWLDRQGSSIDLFSSTLTITDSALVIDAALQGLGVSLARSHLVKRELESGLLIRLFDGCLVGTNAYWLVWSGGSPKRAVIDIFSRWISRQF